MKKLSFLLSVCIIFISCSKLSVNPENHHNDISYSGKWNAFNSDSDAQINISTGEEKFILTTTLLVKKEANKPPVKKHIVLEGSCNIEKSSIILSINEQSFERLKNEMVANNPNPIIEGILNNATFNHSNSFNLYLKAIVYEGKIILAYKNQEEN